MDHNTANTQSGLIIFWSGIAVMQLILWTEDKFWVSYSQSNVLCSSEDSFQSIILSLVWVPVSLYSICKYWISVNGDTTTLNSSADREYERYRKN